MEHSDYVTKYLQGAGVEIGAFRTPIPGIRPVYVDRFKEYAGAPTLADYYGDACDLPFLPDSLCYVASSHVIEHVANPIAAFAEWVRVLRHGGYVYMVVPDRAKTFDRPRSLTPVAHMLDDYRRGVTQSDGTHIDDFVFGVDWTIFSPSTPVGQERAARESLAAGYRQAVAAGNEINIHFHTFESPSVVELIGAANTAGLWEGELAIKEVVESFPQSNPLGFLVVAEVRKPWRHRWQARFSPKGLRDDARRL